MSDALHIQSVTVRDGNQSLIEIGDLVVQPGEMTALVGPSGCGKTLLLRALARALPPNLSATQQTTPTRPAVAWMPQDCLAALDPLRTVGEQLRQTLSTCGSQDSVEQVLGSVGLTTAEAHRFPAQLSGGMAQRVVLAQAVAMRVNTLLVDEPTSGLDPLLTEQVVDLIASHLSPCLGVLWVSHDLRQVRGRANSVWVMDAGRIVETATRLHLLHSSVARELLRNTPGLGLA